MSRKKSYASAIIGMAVVAAVVCGAAALYLLTNGRRSARRAAQKVGSDSSRLIGDSELPPWFGEITIQL